MTINVLVLENDIFVTKEIVKLLAKNNVKICLVNKYEESIKLTESFLPDIIISDINFGELKTELDWIKKMQKKVNAETVFLIESYDSFTLSHFIDVNINQFILKPINKDQFNASMELLIKKVEQNKKSFKEMRIDLLTKLELNIIHFISEGKTSKEISEHLGVKLKTVENYRTNIAIKLEIPAGKNSLMKWVLMNNKRLMSI